MLAATASLPRACPSYTAALSCLQRLFRLCDTTCDTSAFIVLSTDKCEASLASLAASDTDTPYIARHGSTSVSVNFHSLYRPFTLVHRDGFALLAEPQNAHSSIVTCVFGRASPALRACIVTTSTTCMTVMSPDSFYCLMDRLLPVSTRVRALRSHTRFRLSVPACLALLRLSLFDTGVFLAVCKPLQHHLAETGVSVDDERELVQVSEHTRTHTHARRCAQTYTTFS